MHLKRLQHSRQSLGRMASSARRVAALRSAGSASEEPVELLRHTFAATSGMAQYGLKAGNFENLPEVSASCFDMLKAFAEEGLQDQLGLLCESTSVLLVWTGVFLQLPFGRLSQTCLFIFLDIYLYISNFIHTYMYLYIYILYVYIYLFMYVCSN